MQQRSLTAYAAAAAEQPQSPELEAVVVDDERPLAGLAPTHPALAPSVALPIIKPVKGSRMSIVACALLLDCSLIWLAFCGAYYLRYVAQWAPVDRTTLLTPFRDWVPFGIVFSVTMLASLVISGVYRSRLGRDLIDEVGAIVRATLIAVGIVVIANSFLPVVQYSRLVIVYGWVFLVLVLVVGKALLYLALGRLHGSGWNTRRVLVVGATPHSKMVMQNLLAKRNHGYYLVGFVQESGPGGAHGSLRPHAGADGLGHGPKLMDPASASLVHVLTTSDHAEVANGAALQEESGLYPVPLRADFGRFKCLGGVEDLQVVVQEWGVDEVIVALPATHHSEIGEVCAHCQSARVAVKMVPDLFEMSLSQVRMDHLAGIPLIDVHGTGGSRSALLMKRAMDIVISGILLILLSPIFLLTALAIKLSSHGPVLANQQRVGRGGKLFTFYKFRSMYVDADQRLAALAAEKGLVNPRIFKDRHDPRRTRVGRVIRRLSIDEAPQFFNILRGDMSLVGPRPPLPHEVEHYEPHHYKRLEVIGGLTGMWQVNGRSNIESFEEIIIMDTYYIDNWSLALDLKILLRTVLAVLTRNGAY